MNPNEIKKAFECCTCPVYDCDSCPLYGKLQEDCVCENHLMKHALAYINQLEAEVKTVKSEAVKEFDEILKEDCLSCPLEAGDVTMLVDVDGYNNLLKEMVGDEE